MGIDRDCNVKRRILLVIFVSGAMLVTWLFVNAKNPIQENKCKPPTKEELGRHTWIFLHTLASNFHVNDDSDEASTLQQITSLLRTFGELYPCRTCGEHFLEMLQKHPPKVSSRSDFEVWLCERHNEVNTRLTKKPFDCSLENIRAHYEQTDGCPV